MKKITLTLLILITSACSTSYQPDDWTGGYTELQLSDNVYKVAFSGNGYTSRTTVENYTLLRCAELTLEKGYKYFIIIDGKTTTSSSTVTTPTTTYGSATVTGNSVYGTTTTYGGQTYDVVKASGSNTITMLNQRPKGKFAYDAEMINQSLKKRYGLD